MKKSIVIFLAVLMVINLAACGNTKAYDNGQSDIGMTEKRQHNNMETDETPAIVHSTESRVLIAYYSVPEGVKTDGVDAIASASIVVDNDIVKGNSEYVAEIIQETIGGDLFRIDTVERYPLEHEALVNKAATEQDEEKRPELSSHIENFENYETIILVYPNWWGNLPMAVYSFLEEYDFGANNIIPVVTHGGSGFSDTVNIISDIQPDAQVKNNGLAISRNEVASSYDAVVKWASGLGLNKTQAN